MSLSSDQTLRETVLGAISGLGGCGLPVCDAPQRPGPQVSHLVVSAAGGSGGGLARLKRTGKLLFAMARGLPVVTADWVLHSVSAGKWLDAAGFVAVPTHPRAQRQLHGKLFYVNSTDTIDKPTLESLIHDAGGSIVLVAALRMSSLPRRVVRPGILLLWGQAWDARRTTGARH